MAEVHNHGAVRSIRRKKQKAEDIINDSEPDLLVTKATTRKNGLQKFKFVCFACGRKKSGASTIRREKSETSVERSPSCSKASKREFLS